jgi:hypothetical protein
MDDSSRPIGQEPAEPAYKYEPIVPVGMRRSAARMRRPAVVTAQPMAAAEAPDARLDRYAYGNENSVRV